MCDYLSLFADLGGRVDLISLGPSHQVTPCRRPVCPQAVYHLAWHEGLIFISFPWIFCISSIFCHFLIVPIILNGVLESLNMKTGARTHCVLAINNAPCKLVPFT